MIQCPNCSAEIPVDARFCNKCGHNMVNSKQNPVSSINSAIPKTPVVSIDIPSNQPENISQGLKDSQTAENKSLEEKKPDSTEQKKTTPPVSGALPKAPTPTSIPSRPMSGSAIPSRPGSTPSVPSRPTSTTPLTPPAITRAVKPSLKESSPISSGAELQTSTAGETVVPPVEQERAVPTMQQIPVTPLPDPQMETQQAVNPNSESWKIDVVRTSTVPPATIVQKSAGANIAEQPTQQMSTDLPFSTSVPNTPRVDLPFSTSVPNTPRVDLPFQQTAVPPQSTQAPSHVKKNEQSQPLKNVQTPPLTLPKTEPASENAREEVKTEQKPLVANPLRPMPWADIDITEVANKTNELRFWFTLLLVCFVITILVIILMYVRLPFSFGG